MLLASNIPTVNCFLHSVQRYNPATLGESSSLYLDLQTNSIRPCAFTVCARSLAVGAMPLNTHYSRAFLCILELWLIQNHFSYDNLLSIGTVCIIKNGFAKYIIPKKSVSGNDLDLDLTNFYLHHCYPIKLRGVSLNAMNSQRFLATKLYHMDFREPVARLTLADGRFDYSRLQSI